MGEIIYEKTYPKEGFEDMLRQQDESDNGAGAEHRMPATEQFFRQLEANYTSFSYRPVKNRRQHLCTQQLKCLSCISWTSKLQGTSAIFPLITILLPRQGCGIFWRL